LRYTRDRSVRAWGVHQENWMCTLRGEKLFWYKDHFVRRARFYCDVVSTSVSSLRDLIRRARLRDEFFFGTRSFRFVRIICIHPEGIEA
jgi:hypothetical protein